MILSQSHYELINHGETGRALAHLVPVVHMPSQEDYLDPHLLPITELANYIEFDDDLGDLGRTFLKFDSNRIRKLENECRQVNTDMVNERKAAKDNP